MALDEVEVDKDEVEEDKEDFGDTFPTRFGPCWTWKGLWGHFPHSFWTMVDLGKADNSSCSIGRRLSNEKEKRAGRTEEDLRGIIRENSVLLYQLCISILSV